MRNQKGRPKTEKTHQGEGGRIYKGDGVTDKEGQLKGHDLLSSDGHTAGIGNSIDSPAEAHEIDRAHEDADARSNERADERSDERGTSESAENADDRSKKRD